MIDDKRKIALLEATLKEILRISNESDTSTDGSVAIVDALDGKLRRQWIDILSKAKVLLQP